MQEMQRFDAHYIQTELTAQQKMMIFYYIANSIYEQLYVYENK